MKKNRSTREFVCKNKASGFFSKKIVRVINRTFSLCIFGILLLGFIGCSRAPINKVSKNIDNTYDKIQDMKDKARITPPPSIAKEDYYYDKTPISDENRPLWLYNNITLTVKKAPLSFVMNKIFRNDSVLVRFGTGVNRSKLVSMNYSGSVKGALERIACQIDYAYDATDSELRWASLIARSFDISFMPGASSYLVGQNSGSGGSSGSSGSSSGGSASVSTTSGDLMNSSKEYSGLYAASLSIWEDLRKTLDGFKSPDGKINVSEATTMVTVYDKPSNVFSMAKYIYDLNRSISRQVRLKVQVLEVDLDKEHLYGIDWNLVQRWLKTDVGVSGSLATAANVSNAISGNAGVSAFSPISIQLGRGGNSAVLQALATQGKVSVVTEPTVVTMNNQVAEIRIGRDTSYLQNVSVTSSTTSSSDSTPTVSLTPGVVRDGLILYLLPKIKDDKIYLQISSTLSSLISINTVDSSGAINKSSNSGSKLSNAIQIPTLSEKRFNMRSLLPNSYTLVIAGFKQVTNKYRETDPFGIKLVGSKGSQATNNETIVLITPTIVED